MLDPRTVGIRGAINSLNRRRLHVGAATLADRVYPPGLLMDIVLVLCGAAIVSLAAQFVVPIGPVPSTGQIIGVLLAGYALGALRGGLAIVVYIVLGGAGLPVFNQGASGWSHVMGTTGGYLFGFITVAVLVGFAAHRGWDRRLGTAIASSMLALALIYAVGVVWLIAVQGYSPARAIAEGFLPLVVAGIVKTLFVAVLLPIAWHIERTLARRAGEGATRPRTDTLRT